MDRTRRAMLGAPLAALATGGAMARTARPSIRGLAVPSLSIQLAGYSADAEQGFSVRLCQYPTLGIAWIWAQAFDRGRFWGYAEDEAPLPRDSRRDGPPAVFRQASGAAVRFLRNGSEAEPGEVRLRARLHAHANPRAPKGLGPVPVAIDAVFSPTVTARGVLANRSEAKGRVTAEVIAGRSRFRLSGEGAFHEQPQDQPRFTAPFVYMRGSGDDLAFTFIKAPRAASGFLSRAGREARLTEFRIAAPAPHRGFQAALDPGGELRGRYEATHTFWVPIFDQWRRSDIVRGDLDGQAFVGGVNDWLGEQIRYDEV